MHSVARRALLVALQYDNSVQCPWLKPLTQSYRDVESIKDLLLGESSTLFFHDSTLTHL